VALAIRGRAAELYVNGSLYGTKTVMPVRPTQYFAVGATPEDFGAARFKGEVDEVRMFTFQPDAFVAGDLLVNAQKIALTGDGSFGPVPVGGPSGFAKFSLKNSGGSLLTVASLSVEGADAADFSVQGIHAPISLGPGRVLGLQVIFTPHAPGPRTAVLKVTSDDPGQPVVTLPLSGLGLPAPEISVLSGSSSGSGGDGEELGDGGSAQDFPSGGQQPLSFTVRNNGTADLTGLALTMAGTNAEEFHATLSGPPTLTPGQSTSITVTFASTACGVRRADLVVVSNDYDEGRFRIPLTGTGSGPKIGVASDVDGRVLESGRPGFTGIVTAYLPEAPAGLCGVTAVQAGISHALALKSDGTVVAWGYDEGEDTLVPAGLKDVTAVAAGFYHSVALRADGTVAAWGDDSYGQADVPADLSGVTAVTAGGFFTAALKDDGSVAAWGNVTLPVGGISGVTAIAAGNDHLLCLKSDGTVADFAADGSARATPAGLSNVVAISSGGDLEAALTGDGTVVTWRVSGGAALPSAHPGVTGVKTLSVDEDNAMVLKTDGTVTGWGPDFDHGVRTDLQGLAAISGGGPHFLWIADSVVDFGGKLIGETGTVRTFTVTNQGRFPLEIAGVGFAGDPNGFYVAGGVPHHVAAGGTANFGVIYRPSVPGNAQAVLRVMCNDSDQGDFDIRLTATATRTPLETWRWDHFGTTAGEGDAADLADPNGNGMANLLEYALGGDPLGSGPDVAPKYGMDGSGRLKLSFTHDRRLTDVKLTVQGADSPGGPWTDLAVSTGGQPFQALQDGVFLTEDLSGAVSVIDLPDSDGAPAPRRFMRMQVAGQ
jgi:hypothetical protein